MQESSKNIKVLLKKKELDGCWIPLEKIDQIPLHENTKSCLDSLKQTFFPPVIIGIQKFRVDRFLENGEEQPIYIDLEISYPSWKIDADKIQKTISYQELARICMARTAKKEHILLETLARDILQSIQERFSILGAKIHLSCPNISPFLDAFFIEMEI